MKYFPPWCCGLVVFLTLLAAGTAQAQIKVDIGFRRTLYMVYEPIICTVNITNLTGAPLELSDTDKDRWFSFQIETTDGRPIPPVNPDYRNEPASIGPGQKVVRAINLTPLYPLSEFGTYRVKAAIYSKQDGHYYPSSPMNIEITEGRLLWQQNVGVPPGAGAGNSRTISILAHRLPRTSMLYLRVEDRDSGIVYCTSQLGRFVAFGNTDIQLDGNNQIHILQNTAPKAFLYSQFDINGKVIKQQGYQLINERPYLRHNPDGTIVVVGGVAYDPNAPPPERQLPKLSDRPVPLPTPQTKPTPEDKRPENLLSR